MGQTVRKGRGEDGEETRKAKGRKKGNKKEIYLASMNVRSLEGKESLIEIVGAFINSDILGMTEIRSVGNEI